jgi:hypothetical protein
VTHGDGSRLCHGNDVPAYRDRRGSMGVQEFLRGVVVLLERSVRSRSCWTSWTYGRTDRAGLVRYADSFANLRVLLLMNQVSSAHARVLLKPGRHTRVASCRTAAPGRISGAPLLLCSGTNGPQPACAWSVALHSHAPAETNRAGRQSCVARRTRVALLLSRPPHGWRELAVPGCT